jgi:RNA polymerase sigma factor (sigma-70 family)
MARSYTKNIPSTWTRERKIATLMTIAETVSSRWTDRLGSGYDKEDIKQIAALAIIEAVDVYDETKGTKLTSYAMGRVNHAIQRAVRSTTHKCQGVRARTFFIGHTHPDEKRLEEFECPRNQAENVNLHLNGSEIASLVRKCLPSRDADIFLKHHLEDCSAASLAKEYNLTTSRIHQILNNAPELLRAQQEVRALILQ